MAATYYVDFAAGVDSNTGSIASPFKHCPGDPGATVNANITLSAGDTVLFKGGVPYYGLINVNAAGTSGNPITFDSYGTGNGIIDGTTNMTFSVCTGQGTGPGQVDNANWASIYYATMPATKDWYMPVFDGTNNLPYAGTEAYPDPFYYDNINSFLIVTNGGTNQITSTNCTYAQLFTNADVNYYNQANLYYLKNGNVEAVGIITNYFPASNTVWYYTGNLADTPETAPWDNNQHFTIFNHAHFFKQSGTYVVNSASNTVWVWPSSSIGNITVGNLQYAFNLGGNSYIHIQNLQTRGTYVHTYVPGSSIWNSSSAAVNGVLIANCTFYNQCQQNSTATTYIFGAGVSNNIIRNCVEYRVRGRGLYVTGNGSIIQSNTISYITGTGIYSQQNTTSPNINGSFLDNYIHDTAGGIHANGMSIYGGASVFASNWMVARNLCIRCSSLTGPFALTLQGQNDITIENNVLEGQVADNGPQTNCNYMRWYNNTIAGLAALYAYTNTTGADIRNNIFMNGMNNNTPDVWTNVIHKYNIYINYGYRQAANYGWTNDATEFQTTTNALFTTAITNDIFLLSSNSTAIGMATNLTALFTNDLDGISRPSSGAWDIGAYAFSSGSPPSSGVWSAFGGAVGFGGNAATH